MGVESLGTREFTALQLMQIIGDRQVKITPDMQANGGGTGNGAGGGLVEALVGLLVQVQAEPAASKTSAVSPAPTTPQEPAS